MNWRRRNGGGRHYYYGIIVSLTVHLLIFMVPIFLVRSKPFTEVEIFVLEEKMKEPGIKPMVKKLPEKKKVPPLMVKKPSQPLPKKPLQPIIKKEPLPEDTPVVNPVISEPVVAPQPEEAFVLPHSLALSPLPPEFTAPPVGDVDFGSMNGPRFLNRKMPVYPLMARRLGKEGRVLLRLTIDDKGNLLGVEVVEGMGFGFTGAAIEAVKKSTFLPARRGQIPVKSRALLPIKFILRGDG